jgi:hypothetical protein
MASGTNLQAAYFGKTLLEEQESTGSETIYIVRKLSSRTKAVEEQIELTQGKATEAKDQVISVEESIKSVRAEAHT